MSAESKKLERDAATGVEIRHHEWDGIQELNNPLPRWWLIVFASCIVWAIGYWIVMPAWPLVSGYTKGALGWSQRAHVAHEIEEVAKSREPLNNKLLATPLADIERDPELVEYAVATARPVFKENCGPCHGAGAQGGVGYPNLNDDDWIWGGSLSAIEQTITHGIRNQDAKSRFSEMPAFLKLGTLNRSEIDALATYVLSLSGGAIDETARKKAVELFAANCASCHGPEGKGDRSVGALNLTDKIWLYGGNRAAIVQTISYARNSSMPAWDGRLSPATIRALAIYVHTRGGGEPEPAANTAAARP